MCTKEYTTLGNTLLWRDLYFNIHAFYSMDSAIDALGMSDFPVRGQIVGHFDLIQFINLVHSLEIDVLLFSHKRVVCIQNNQVTSVLRMSCDDVKRYTCVLYDGLYYHKLKIVNG
jgi:hypothetical protein